MAKNSKAGAAQAQAAAIRATKTAAAAAQTGPNGRPLGPGWLQHRTGGWYRDPRYLPTINPRTGQTVPPKIAESKTLPTRDTQIRIPSAENKQIFYPIPQNHANPASYGRFGNTSPGTDEILQGRAAQEKFGTALGQLQASERSLQLSNLTGRDKDPKNYVVGTQARISALRSARSSLMALDTSGRGQSTAAKTLFRNIEENLKLAQGQRDEVQSVLSSFRAKQRSAMRVNAEVQSGRRPRRSGAAAIPNLPGLLGPTRKY